MDFALFLKSNSKFKSLICNVSLEMSDEPILFPTKRIVSALEFEGFGRRTQAKGVG